MWNKRETEGEFQTLYKELIDEETKFYGYFWRMSMNTFDVLLKKLKMTYKNKTPILGNAYHLESFGCMFKVKKINK